MSDFVCTEKALTDSPRPPDSAPDVPETEQALQQSLTMRILTSDEMVRRVDEAVHQLPAEQLRANAERHVSLFQSLLGSLQTD